MENLVAEPVTKARAKTASSEEVQKTLDKIFDSVSSAIAKNNQKITLESVDKTLAALFEAVNKAPTEGPKVKIPDFEKILKG